MNIKNSLDPQLETQLAKDLFNLVWGLLEKSQRTATEDELMVHAAHASRYHWSQVGTSVHAARGDWQISRVYAVLRRADEARRYARSCLAACEAHDLSGFDRAFAHEALARAAALAGDRSERDASLRAAREVGAKITDADDRKWLEQNLAEIEGPCMPGPAAA